MPNDAPLISWLDHLWQLYPAQGVLLVGAGNGASAWIEALQHWNAPNVMLVEADETQFQHLQRSLAATKGWQLRKQVVAQEAGSVTFHQASNPAESGLLEPETLRALWPNLKTRHKSTRQSITLAELLPMTKPGANWLLLDCLPAAPLLAGARAALDSVDVILTRALLPEPGHGATHPGADASAVAQWLQAHGFCTVATQTGRHPNTVHTLHVRDRSAQLQKLTAELAELRQAQHAAEQTAQKHQALLTEREAQAKTLQQELTALQQQLAESTQANIAADTALQACDAQLNTLQTELAQARQTGEQAKQEASQQQQRVTQLQAEANQWREAAEKARADAAQALAQAQDAMSAADKTRQDRDAQIKALQTELTSVRQAAEQAQQAVEHKQQQLEQLTAQVAQASQGTAEQKDTLQTVLAELQALKSSAQPPPKAPGMPEPLLTSLQEIKAAVSGGFNGLKDSLKALPAPATDDNGELKAMLTQQQTSLQGLAQQLGQLDLAAPLGKALDEQLTKQLAGGKESLKEVETRLRNDLNKGLANAVKQMEAFMRIQSFLGDGDSLGDFHGWPISPDIGLFLLDRMREQHYDLIIEFGSGTSTALFARAAEVLAQQAAAKATEGSANPGPAKTTIVSFEHDTLYHGKTQQMLKARGLQQHVRLVHAPLVDWRDGEQTYLYYDCQATLAELAQQHANRQLRILLLVDGPPGATCPNARYPAVPFVFTALGRHQIDVVLDDASRPEEKQVIELWKTFWKQRSFRFAECQLPSEKGIYLATPLK